MRVLPSKERNHRNEVSHEARIAGCSVCPGADLVAVQGVLQDVKHAFYGLCIQAGREVLAQMLEADRVTLCGAKNVPDSIAPRFAWRQHEQPCRARRPTHRHQAPAGARDRRGRARAAELCLGRGVDPLNMATMAAIAAGVSTRRYAGTLDELAPPEAALCTSKSAVSRRFVALSQGQL